MRKLDISKIMKEAILLPVSNFGQYTKSLAIPVLIMVVIWSIWVALSTENASINIVFYFLYIFAFSYFAVNCHRLILVGASKSGLLPYSNIRTIALFTIYFIFIYLFSVIIEWVLITILINVFDSGELSKEYLDNVRTIVYLPSMYIVARLCLVFPATALGYRPSLKWSWRETKGHSLRILVIVAVFPWALIVLLSLIQRDGSTALEQVVLGLLWYTVSAIGIFALSLTYRDLKSYAESKL